MILHRLNTGIPEGMGDALAGFEREFSYPLGSSGRFRISHGEDYLRFFQAMGEAQLLLLEKAGVVQGVLARVERSLELRSEAGLEQLRTAHYLCDLKLRASARGSLSLPRLIRETKRAIESSGSHCCYCVVMEGTGKLPTDYTGRLGVPRFQRLGEIAILRIEASGNSGSLEKITPDDFAKLRSGLTRPGYSATTSTPESRSLMEPMHLTSANGDACGILEDTRRGKRLFLEEGPEMLSAHLSRFAYAHPAAGAHLLKGAAALAGERGMPALFVAVPQRASEALLRELEGVPLTIAPAAVYGHALKAGADWWIDTAEI
jgi:hypothetical protein